MVQKDFKLMEVLVKLEMKAESVQKVCQLKQSILNKSREAVNEWVV
jgi:hypothetical protein